MSVVILPPRETQITSSQNVRKKDKKKIANESRQAIEAPTYVPGTKTQRNKPTKTIITKNTDPSPINKHLRYGRKRLPIGSPGKATSITISITIKIRF